MTIPGMAYLIINNYLPMAGILLAFRKVNFAGGITGGEWVGLQNFEFLLKSQNTWQIIRNTIGYNILFIILGTICAVLLAIILNEAASKIAIGVGQTVTLLPQMISMVLVSYIVQGFLQPDYGLLNSQVLPALGLEPVNWYWDRKRVACYPAHRVPVEEHWLPVHHLLCRCTRHRPRSV